MGNFKKWGYLSNAGKVGGGGGGWLISLYRRWSKPVMIVTVDGFPDENPRYMKTIKSTIDLSPHRTFNRIGCRMVKFNHEVSGIILPPDKFGSHLIRSKKRLIQSWQRKTSYMWDISELKSGQDDNQQSHVLGRIHQWRGGERNTKKSLELKSNHIRESQYFFQIVKCLDENCCRPLRSSYLKIITEMFLPPPIAVTRITINELKCVKRHVDAHYLFLWQNLYHKIKIFKPTQFNRSEKFSQGYTVWIQLPRCLRCDQQAIVFSMWFIPLIR